MSLPYDQEFELYHYGESICSQKARVGMIEKNVPYKSHHISLCGFSAGCENLSPEYVRVNPRGQVPTFVHNGEPVYDGHFIVKYVHDLFPEQGERLWPTDASRQEIVQEWFDTGMLKDDAPEDAFGTAIAMLTVPVLQTVLKMHPEAWLEESLSRHPTPFRIPLYLGMRRAPEIPPPPSSAIDAVCRGLKRANENLTQFGGPWLLGDFSLADVTMMACFHRLEDVHLVQILHDQRLPELGDYWERLQGRRSYEEGIVAWHDNEYWRKAIEDIYGQRQSPILEQVREHLRSLDN